MKLLNCLARADRVNCIPRDIRSCVTILDKRESYLQTGLTRELVQQKAVLSLT
jgi:hypothetical protein